MGRDEYCMCVCVFFFVCAASVCVCECFAFEWILKSPSVFHYHSAQTQLVFHRQLSHLPRVCVCVCVQTHYWRLQIKKKEREREKGKKMTAVFTKRKPSLCRASQPWRGLLHCWLQGENEFTVLFITVYLQC